MKDAPGWKKSTMSGNDCDCVEVRVVDRTVLIRDSKNTAGPVVELSHQDWRELLEHLKR